ncbi:MAG: ribosomal-processing cysteine protease Prp [Tenericutes bacterium]|jgi:uncharacterized protein YsxB (DUF464 family)|nr:ribosomal-processing cysteine protease Prp [Mycoplasmatota bacterium]
MIKIEILKNNYVKQVIIKGHANYQDYGKDIVCSAVSSIVITSVNGIIAINEKTINYEEAKDKITINIALNDEITNKLMLNMINLLKELQIQYPKNIYIKEENL